MAEFKPTLKKPPSEQSKKFISNFDKTMAQSHIKLDEVDNLLSEREQSLKKKIFSLAKMEALVFSDPKLSMIYDEMAVNGEEKYGYHYNETIQNMIFNDYVLNSPKYLQKYKMAIPKKKKRRDKSGINQLKKAGEEKMKNVVSETNEPLTKVLFLVNEKNPQNPDVFAYFPEENYDNQGRLKAGYSHIGQHSAVDPRYAKESRLATPEEYNDLKIELEGQGYYLEVLNSTNETTGAGGAGGAAFSGSGQYTAPLGYEKKVDETTGSASSGQYSGPAVWGSGDLMKAKGTANVKTKPAMAGGTIIGESKNYLIDPSGFEKYVNKLNEQIDVENSNVSQEPNIKPYTNNNINNDIIDKTSAFTSNTVKQWGKPDTELQYNTIKTGKMDEPNLNIMENNQNMITTIEQLKQLKANGQKITKELIPSLAGEALHRIAIQLANKMLPVTWDDLPDTNSMWDYINPNGGMDYDELINAVKEAVNDRLSEDGMSLEDLMENKINEKAKSKAQQRLFGMAHAVQKGELSPNKVGGAVKKIAKTVSPEDVEDFAKTKTEDLPEKINEEYSISNPQPSKQIGWVEIPAYKSSGGAAIFELNPENDSWGIDRGAQYLIGSDKYEEFKLVQHGEPNNYIIQHNPLFWTRYIKLDEDAQKIYYLDDNGNFKYLGKYKNIKIDPNNERWHHNIQNDRFMYKIEDMKKEGATFMYDNKPIFTDNENMNEDMQSMIGDSPDTMALKPAPTGTQGSNAGMGMQTSGMANESIINNKTNDMNLLETLNKELEAFSVHHENLKKMTEDRKPSALVLKDRLGSENEKNFKSDLKDSSISKIVDIENALEFSDQQTDVKDPMKLGQDIEKLAIKLGDMKSGEALKNVGDSTNDNGDEIPKRNLTDDEQNEVNNYRLGLGDLVYDNEPSKRFEDRMKADMGDKLYKQRQDKLKFRGKAPMYNKDPQPVEDTTSDKVQFNKEQSGWNEREGLKESMITGRYHDVLNKRRLIDFTLNEVKIINKLDEGLFPLDFTGLGNSYNGKTENYKVKINETVVNVLNGHKFYTDGKNIFAVKNSVQNLTETEHKEQKRPVNEQVNKMKHLLGYKPESFTNTINVKKNRGF